MKNLNKTLRIAYLRASAIIAISATSATAQESYSPYAGEDYPDNVYWGDTHLHTNLSVDAYSGGTTMTPEDAYRFARGETVKVDNGAPLRIRRPLDFLVVADHAENLGVLNAVEAGDPALLARADGKRVKEALSKRKSGGEANPNSFLSLLALMRPELASIHPDVVSTVGSIGDAAFRRTVWENVINAAERYNDPGKFTAFIGYEWTPMQTFLHRVVLFKDGAAKAGAVPPFTALDSARAEDLWAHLADYEKKTGGEVLAIPHNSNLTKGRMFLTRDSDGRPFTQDYAQRRIRFESLFEVTQNKGDSETHPELSPDDEFADYERLKGIVKGEDFGLEYSYARSALKLGLGQEEKLGVNPFKFGLIGSTDSHTGLSEVDPENFRARFSFPPSSFTAPYPDPAFKRFVESYRDLEPYFDKKANMAGYAAVWATENTREALFAAMKRKETYATTGPRINLRFFGGWGYSPDDALKPDLARIGYAKGVPMGGDLAQAPKGKAPSFLIRAVKDPDWANLDRIQIIKGWLDAKGATHEKIYNVALSDGRKEDKAGKAPPVGSTVDVKDASYTNAIGDPELAVVWTDPDFDPKARAFYYVRVLEIPTPRWAAHYVQFSGLKDVPSEILMAAQQRAYSSPIWYTPWENDGL